MPTNYYAQLYDEPWLRSQYTDKAMSIPEIARVIGCSDMAVHKALKRFDIPRRKPGELRKGRQRSDARYGPGPNGERRAAYHSGYVKIQVDGKWLPEHRHVAAQVLGRPLTKGETVHHINGIRDDNRPENLMVFTSNSEHRRHHYELLRDK